MAIASPLYYAQFPLQEAIFDKDTGNALAAGIIQYFSDPQFTVPKDVFEQSNAPDGSFIYTNLGSVLTLSSIGTFVDPNGQNFIPFLYPWKTNPDTGSLEFQPYYIQVYSSGNILQFTVDNWPPIEFTGNNVTSDVALTQNQFTNSQFSEVLFSATPPGSTYIIPVSGSNTITAIAPGWFINTNGADNVTLSQVGLQIETPSNAPYALQITVGSSITSATLYQRICMSPRLFEGKTVSAYFEAASTTAVSLTLNYIASNNPGIDIPLATGSSGTAGNYAIIKNTVVIDAALNTTSPTTGYIDLSLVLIPGTTISVTSFQLVAVDSDLNVPDYAEISVPLQQAQLFWYWQPKLNYKPLPSYLIGWDFGLNPAQFGGTSVAAATLGGANLSRYVWDQTILFTAVDDAMSVSRTSQGQFSVATTTGSTFAVIQYLPQATAREILNQRNSISLQGIFTPSTAATTITGTVGIYWTSTTLPNITGGANFYSLVSGITSGASGAPPTTTVGTTPGSYGVWTQVPNTILGASAPFVMTTTDTQFNFSGFDATATNAGSTATALAVVISFNTLAATDVVSLDYCSLVGGDIPTRPAPQTPDEVLRECEYYYETSFPAGSVPGTTVTSINAIGVPTVFVSGSTSYMYATRFTLQYRTVKNSAPPYISLYTPITPGSIDYVFATLELGAPTIDPIATNVSTGSWTPGDSGTKSVTFIPTTNSPVVSGGSSSNNTGYYAAYTFQYTADCRLGIQ